jgi:hypothetical protein
MIRLPFFHEGVLECEYPIDPATEVVVRLTGPAGEQRQVHAFCDGGPVWRWRCDVESPGTWSFAVQQAAREKWLGAEGDFVVHAYAGANPLYRHGPLRVSSDGFRLEHADGRPFFWMADTAWNGVLAADSGDWDRYLALRREQGFTAVQCVLTNWRAFPADAHGERAWTGDKDIRVNPGFFRRLDDKVAAIAAAGLVPALVVLWTLTPWDPGLKLAEDDAIRLARYITARYAAFRPVWLLGGDGRYLADGAADRWKRIGRAVLGTGPRAERPLAALHPCGRSWIGDEFRGEPWFDFVGYQSGHGGDAGTFDWITQGPPATQWRGEPQLPVINLEPCYEGHKRVGTDLHFSATEVRSAMYWSLLVSPTAGVTYGHHSIWPWVAREESPLDHRRAGTTPPWSEALQTRGTASVTALRVLFDRLPWHKLRPAPRLLASQPGAADTAAFVAAAAAEDGSFAVIYLPRGGEVALAGPAVTLQPRRWFDPRTAAWRPADAGAVLHAPDSRDWVLVLGA